MPADSAGASRRYRPDRGRDNGAQASLPWGGSGQVVTALLGSGTGNIALKARDKREQLTHERQDLLARHLAKYDEVKARAAAMGPK